MRPARVVNGAGAGVGDSIDGETDEEVAAGGGAHCDVGEHPEAAGGEEVGLGLGAGETSLVEVPRGADIAGGKNGLSLSTDTVQGLSPRRSTKVLAVLSKTSKGPE